MQNLLLDDKFRGKLSWRIHSPSAVLCKAENLGEEVMAPVGVRDCGFVKIGSLAVGSCARWGRRGR